MEILVHVSLLTETKYENDCLSGWGLKGGSER